MYVSVIDYLRPCIHVGTNVVHGTSDQTYILVNSLSDPDSAGENSNGFDGSGSYFLITYLFYY